MVRMKSLAMINLLSKSPKGLMRNESGTLDHLLRQLILVLAEQRHQRSDLQDIKRMINRLLIDEHLQQQVDQFFEDDKEEVLHELEDK